MEVKEYRFKKMSLAISDTVVMAGTPQARKLTLFVSIPGGKKVGINPKINNLMPGYEGAKHGLVWICDSGIRGRKQTLCPKWCPIPYIVHYPGQ